MYENFKHNTLFLKIFIEQTETEFLWLDECSSQGTIFGVGERLYYNQEIVIFVFLEHQQEPKSSVSAIWTNILEDQVWCSLCC